MAYIGIQPAEKFTSFATQEFSTSATTSYTLDHAVANENELALFVNNVRQQPGSGKAYTASGTALTLSAATASTDTMYCVFLGRALQTVTPATNSITAAMVGNDLISGKDALTSSPADTDELLISDAGTLKRIDVSLVGGKNTPFTTVKKSSDQTLAHGADTKITFDAVINESSSSLFDLTNNKFTVATAGTYLILPQLRFYDSSNRLERAQCNIYKNNSALKSFMHYDPGYSSSNTREVHLGSGFLETLSVNDYIEMYAYVATNDSGDLVAESDYQGTSLGIMRIIT